MKRLWKTVPPCQSDVIGFFSVVNNTDGLGIIDDPSTYKPLRTGQSGGRAAHGVKESVGFIGDFGRDYSRRGGHSERRGHGGLGGYGGRGDIHVVNSDIRNDDIITGTEKKLIQAFYDGAERFQPEFVLLSHAPSSSMIGSDLEAAAARIHSESGLSVACVPCDGGKDYLYGVSITLEAMGRLLIEKRPTQPNTVNLLGCCDIDWTREALDAVESLLSGFGYKLLSCWGSKETAERMRNAGAACANLVVSEAGMRLARYMESEFGIPYVVGAPFGTEQCRRLEAALKSGDAIGTVAGVTENPEVLIIAEQLTANALRAALTERGYKAVRVASFFDMDKSLMTEGDKKLSGEDELAAMLAEKNVRLVLADPDLIPLCAREIPWIALPNPASPYSTQTEAARDMVGGSLDIWLDDELGKVGVVL